MNTNPFKFRWLLFLIVIATVTYGGYRVWALSSRQTAAAASQGQARGGEEAEVEPALASAARPSLR